MGHCQAMARKERSLVKPQQRLANTLQYIFFFTF